MQSINAFTKKLQELGHEVLIIAPQFLKTHNDPSYVKRIPSLLRFTYKKKHMAMPWCAKKYLKEYLQDFSPDVVHVHHPFLLGAMGARVARELQLPVVFTYHTIYEDYVHYIPLPSWIVKPLVTKKVLNFCNKVDRVIAPSSGIKEYLQKNEIMKVVVLPSPLRKEFCGLRLKKQELKPPFQLLCVTRFTKEKNIPALFQMMKKLPNEYCLTLVGYGDQEQALRTQAKQFGNRILFVIGPLSEQLVQLYEQAQLFVFPSQTDTQGIVLAESMATGTPVVALDGMGQKDIIKQGENGFIVEDEDAMANTIQQICKNTDLYKKLQRNALCTALNYDPKIIVENYLEFLRAVIK